MCTVTYIPQAQGCIISSNRDEQVARATKELTEEQLPDGQHLIFPRDAGAGGTWIVLSDQNRAGVILNGAFEKHEVQAPYRISRGLMLLAAFEYPHWNDFFENYDFNNIEPFTLIAYQAGELWEMRWDGTQQHLQMLDAQARYMWSSSTLYPPKIRAKRESWFRTWEQPNAYLSADDIAFFHRTAGDGDTWNDLVMNRKILQTLSISQIIIDKETYYFKYNDLINNQLKIATLAAI